MLQLCNSATSNGMKKTSLQFSDTVVAELFSREAGEDIQLDRLEQCINWDWFIQDVMLAIVFQSIVYSTDDLVRQTSC